MNNTVQFDEFKQLLAQKIGMHIPPDAHERFVRMLHERATRMGYATLEEYRIFLAGQNASGEWEEFARAFISCETFFFRDHGQFDLLRLRLLPELIARHRNDKTLRLWSAGCASGEEAYSLAMLVDMLLPDHGDWNLLILGTDIDSSAIAKARQGHYGQWSFRMVPATLQRRYFREDGSEWELDERIRRMVTFRVANLASSESFSESGWHSMDLILCRNVFIYFDPASVSSIAMRLAAALVEEGYLMTAHTELIGYPVQGLESRLFAEGVVYQRRSHLPTCFAPPPVPSITTQRVASPLPQHVLLAGKILGKETQVLPQALKNPVVELGATARSYADRGEYEQAERLCREALAADPLAASPFFLLAQLAQIKGDFKQAKDYLNKAIYLDRRYVAPYLELAALYERDGDMPRAHVLRRAALEIVRTMPDDEQIEQYERTAGELAQWLAQFESLANNHVNAGLNIRSPYHGQ